MANRKLILSQKNSPGDMVVWTRSVGDLKLTYPEWAIDVRLIVPEIFENSPRITKIADNDPEAERYDCNYPGINQSGMSGLHFADCFREDLENKLNSNPEKVAIYGMTKIKSTGIRPELWISEQEKAMPTQVLQEFKSNKPYWVINAGNKSDYPLKLYPFWQEVVDCFNAKFNGRINLVQIGAVEPNHNHPALRGVFNLVGKTNHRQFIRLVGSAHGTVGGISYQYHLSGGFAQSAVLVLLREGPRFTYYPWTTSLHTTGMLKCCKIDGCWKSKETDCLDLVSHKGRTVPRCTTLISPEEIVGSIEKYYLGGILSYEPERTVVLNPVKVPNPSPKAPEVVNISTADDKEKIQFGDRIIEYPDDNVKGWGMDYTERVVEVPLIFHEIMKYKPSEVLEVGNVLAGYTHFGHDVIDLYEKAEGVINQDIRIYKSEKKYKLIVSTTTLEHVGGGDAWDPGGNRDQFGIIKAIINMIELLENDGVILFAVPIGLNSLMDNLFRKRLVPFTNMWTTKRDANNKWIVVPYESVKDTKGFDPYPGTANASIICEIMKKDGLVQLA